MATRRLVRPASRKRIVVGVDGSEASREALLWAWRQSELTGATLEVVMVCDLPLIYYFRTVPIPGEPQQPLQASERALHGIIHEVLGDSDETKLIPLVLEGRTVPTLLDAAKGADLLVVGSRSHGVLRMLVSSVSEHCVAHASCPVAVVRHHEVS